MAANRKQDADGDPPDAQFNESSVYVSQELLAVKLGDEVEKKLETVMHQRDDLTGLQELLNEKDKELKAVRDQNASLRIMRQNDAETIAAYEKEVASAIREVVGAIKGEYDAKAALELLGAKNVELFATVRLLNDRVASLGKTHSPNGKQVAP